MWVLPQYLRFLCSTQLYNSKSFEKPPTMSEWARFRMYARRVRTLRNSGVRDIMAPEVYSVLQLCAINEPLFPNLRKLALSFVATGFIPFIPLFLSPGITAIIISFAKPNPNKVVVASIFATFPTLCPNLQEISLHSLPRDPVVNIAVSRMLLASNRDALRILRVDFPLTEEAREAIYKLPNLRHLTVVIERGTPLPTLVLPSLISIHIEYEYDRDWLKGFHGATLGKLETIFFDSRSEQIGDSLGEFERVALTASIQNTLSMLCFDISPSWRPNYRSLLPFTHMTWLRIGFSCGGICSSTVDDDVIAALARAMPKLETLKLGGPPCHEIPTGVTAKGLVVLAHHCQNLCTLRIHFQVASLCVPPVTVEVASNTASTAPRRDCALTYLEVGEILVPDESVLMVALTLALIFPHVNYVNSRNEKWEKVVDALQLSRKIVDCSSKDRSLHTP